jgi:hypothetical protein
MTAKIYYLRPLQKEAPGEAAAERTEEDDLAEQDQPAAARTAKRSMPFGRKSKWKKKIGGGVVRRDGSEGPGSHSQD